jgi:hypothetical protein
VKIRELIASLPKFSTRRCSSVVSGVLITRRASYRRPNPFSEMNCTPFGGRSQFGGGALTQDPLQPIERLPEASRKKDLGGLTDQLRDRHPDHLGESSIDCGEPPVSREDEDAIVGVLEKLQITRLLVIKCPLEDRYDEDPSTRPIAAHTHRNAGVVGVAPEV